MNIEHDEMRPVWRPQSQAGHYVVAAAIILAAVLLILFLPHNECCCCCQRAVATTSTTTLGQTDVFIPPGGTAPSRAVARRAVIPAIAVPDVSPPLPAAAYASQSIPAAPVAQTPGDYYTSAAYESVPFLAPIPTPEAIVVDDRDCKRDHDCKPHADVPEAGSSLLWMALGASAIGGLAVVRNRT